MSLRFALAGLKHDHVITMIKEITSCSSTEITATYEEDLSYCRELVNDKLVKITNDNYEEMLSETDCDVVVIADAYGRRGAMVIRALQAGKHVLCDKPVCTRLEELRKIHALSVQKRLKIGCMLDLRGDGALRTARRLISEGRIGEVQTVTFHGQHALYLETRPRWYFDPEQHGGTINDLSIHGLDALTWLTGRKIVEIVAARDWNAKAKPHPLFKDCAQVMLKLENDGGALGDVSYLAADYCGRMDHDARIYPPGWRFTVHGTCGALEVYHASPDVLLSCDGDRHPIIVPAEPSVHDSWLMDFLDDIGNKTRDGGLTTDQILRSSLAAIIAQQAADKQQVNLPCNEF
ncbi:Gfo/Idh/MocA family protein [Verrucomicrobiota bacterium]